MKKTNCVLAKYLSATNIGSVIRFRRLNETTQVSEIIDAELRQIYHVEGSTTVNVGEGASVEYTLEHDDAVVIDPPAFYEGDWVAELGLDGPA
ncbi:hypothetical protein [Mycobacteroides abscessus]|uniref:hypothetical protein n=1 Tax=Mycobacteroides abscessus TaxID=36809 RepID=UPI0009A62DAA|nr:hypothetical protein [Mycobacteroides abscessus]SLH43111.1 Uncharacterised protein [Mycobacteroides abscessus subsp. massiliense]